MAEGEPDPLVGRTLAGKYLVEALLGRGGMGAVYGARQVALEKRVAIKVLHDNVARDAAFVRRFHREAKAASRLDHPSSVRVLDFGQEGEVLYIVMEYLDGRDLGSVLADEHPLDERRMALIVAQILAALTVAHEHGIVHRDLKPENIMVLAREDDDGRPIDVVKVCDFGIATITSASVEEGNTLTSQGMILGTPDYMSPEQARGETLDGRTDIYSVGVILYELLTGRRPFEAESPLGVALRHVNDPVRPPSQLSRSVDRELERICMTALEKQRDRRWQSARQMRAELRAYLEARGSTVPPMPVRSNETALGPTRNAETLAELTADAPKRSRRGGTIATAIAVLAVASVALPRALRRQHLDNATSVTVTTEAPSLSEPTPVLASVEAPPPVSAPVTAPTHHEPPRVAPAKPRSTGATTVKVAAEPAKAVEPLPAPVEAPKETPPSTPAVAVAVAVAAPVAVAPATKPVDAAQAKVTIETVTATNGLPASSVRAALSHVPLTRCYRDALTGKTSPAKGSAVLRLAIDDTGHVVSATLVGATFLPAVKGCIETAARTIQIKNVDTGDASATVTLTFSHP